MGISLNIKLSDIIIKPKIRKSKNSFINPGCIGIILCTKVITYLIIVTGMDNNGIEIINSKIPKIVISTPVRIVMARIQSADIPKLFNRYRPNLFPL